MLLRQQGYSCDGAMLRLYNGEVEGTCCSADDAADARSVAYGLGMKFYVFNETERFARDVMDRFVAEYCAGRTPNPCIDCNRCLKFGALLERALLLGYDYLATGHYARVKLDEASGKYRLLRGRDRSKDQSYVLYQLGQHQLAHLLLPVGEYDKPSIRRSARQAGLINADKSDSQDICFVPDGDYTRFLQEYGGVKMIPGDFVDRAGHVLGRHKGLPCYTTGQRKGLGVSAGKHVYVLRKNAQDNTILLGRQRGAVHLRPYGGPGKLDQRRNPRLSPSASPPKPAIVRQRRQPLCIPCRMGASGWSLMCPSGPSPPGRPWCSTMGEQVLGGGTIE